MLAAFVFQAAAADLTDEQIREAIKLGRAGQVPIVHVGTFLGISKGDFDVFVEGPIARIAAVASRAFKEFRPFDVANVTAEMKSPIYRVLFQRDYRHSSGPVGNVVHVVLQPRRAKGMDGVVQPIKENLGYREAYFDQFPDGEFDVVIVTETATQRYDVDAKARLRIR